MKKKRSEQDIEMLERAYFLFAPSEMFDRCVGSIQDMWQYRHELKHYGYDRVVLKACAELVVRALRSGARFRRYDCIRILRAQVVAGPSSLPTEIVRLFFEIYQRLIFTENESLRWAVSRLVKDQLLEEPEIQWLVENWHLSEHLANRLLLYPVHNKQVWKWSKERLADGALSTRTSELIGILFPKLGFKFFRGVSPTVLAWGIVRAKTTSEIKEGTLLALVPKLSADAIVAIAQKLQSPTIIREALKR